MKRMTPPNDMRTIRLVCEELDSSEGEGPSEAFHRFLSGAGGGGTPKNGRLGGEGFVGDIDGDNDGATTVVELNMFPSLLHYQV